MDVEATISTDLGRCLVDAWSLVGIHYLTQGGASNTMRLGFTFLANAGEFAPDGRLYVLGGDLDILIVPNFPNTQPSMVLVIKFRLDDADLSTDHEIRVLIVGPTGEPLAPQVRAPVQILANPPRPGRPMGLGFVMNMGNLNFPVSGDYVWHVDLDEDELTTLTLRVEQQDQAVEG